MKNIIITIGREFGSGGRFIGRLLANRLGIPFYDNELIRKAAVDTGLNENVIRRFDEKKDEIFISQANPYSFQRPLSQQVFLAEFNAIKNIAKQGSAVIVGRCADYVLKDQENVVSIFISAPFDEKVKRCKEYYNIPEKDIPKKIKKINKSRRKYYNFYTDGGWGEASNYDLAINSKIGIEKAVEIIVNYIKSLE